MSPAASSWAERLAAVTPEGGAMLMEVCGTHTTVARRAGVHSLLPPGVRLLSGPGCPVCVSPVGFVDHAVALARQPHVTIATYGDLIRVPGSTSSLERERSAGHDVRVVYSALDALEIAAEAPERVVVFLGVGFETTAPTAAAAIIEAHRRGLEGFTVLSAHRLVPPALEVLLADGEARVDGFLAPGHVSAVIGLDPYRFVAAEHRRPVVVAGFEAEEMLLGVEMLLAQLSKGEAVVANGYRSVVRDGGNSRARELMAEVFEPCSAAWRGIGEIPASGLRIRQLFRTHDGSARIEVDVEPPHEPEGCECGAILTGRLQPEDCPLFAGRCTPAAPVGACMVSSEGACAAAFRYGSHRA